MLTVGTNKTAEIYQNEIIKLACVRPYLMHAVQPITAVHDRYLSQGYSSKPSSKELYHWSQAAALFREKLSASISSSERDALWVTSVLLVGIALACVDASKPEEAWPLQSSSLSNMVWLRMINGKKAVRNITDPLRKDGVFHKLADKNDASSRVFEHRQSTLLSTLADLCHLTEPSASQNNPYYGAVYKLGTLLDLECDQSTIREFLGFFDALDFEFLGLLERKEPRALLLLAHWYAKVCGSMWWRGRRALLECQATCIYLQRHHGDNAALQELLFLPKLIRGIATE